VKSSLVTKFTEEKKLLNKVVILGVGFGHKKYSGWPSFHKNKVEQL